MLADTGKRYVQPVPNYLEDIYCMDGKDVPAELRFVVWGHVKMCGILLDEDNQEAQDALATAVNDNDEKKLGGFYDGWESSPKVLMVVKAGPIIKRGSTALTKKDWVSAREALTLLAEWEYLDPANALAPSAMGGGLDGRRR